MSDIEKPDKIPIGDVGIDEEFHGKFPTDAFEFTKSSATVPTITVKSAWKLIGDGGVAPIGSIIMFGGATAPIGYVLCNNASLLRAGTYAGLFAVIGTIFGSVDGTHFNVPDMRGIFPRGAGTSGKLNNALGAAFAGVLGTYQNDKFQGHRHQLIDEGSGGSTLSSDITGTGDALDRDIGLITNVITDGTFGTVRAGNETNPANLGVNFIIKY